MQGLFEMGAGKASFGGYIYDPFLGARYLALVTTCLSSFGCNRQAFKILWVVLRPHALLLTMFLGMRGLEMIGAYQ